MIYRAWLHRHDSWPFEVTVARRLYAATDHTVHHGRPPWERVYAWIPGRCSTPELELELWKRAIAEMPPVPGDAVRFKVDISEDIDGYRLRACTRGPIWVARRDILHDTSERLSLEGRIHVLARMAGEVLEAYLLSQLPRTRAT